MKNSPHGIRSESYEPVRMGRNGAVVAAHPLASLAGMTILQRGGNAVDAAVAVGFALGVVEPQSSGIGGDGFVMVHMRGPGGVEVANGTGAAPLAATRARYKDGIPLKGILSVSVPGIVDALLAAHDRHGTLKLAECLAPAIALCEQGTPVTHHQAELIAADETLCSFPTSAAIWAAGGKPAQPGDIVFNPGLAHTMRLIAEQGRDAFYEGAIAREIVGFSEEQGGILTLEDFAWHQVEWQEPISTTYRGHTVYEAPPNSSGHVLLQELNMLERFDVRALGAGTSAVVHLMVEAKKLAFADREAYLADPRFVDVPIEGLLSKEYAAERARLIDPGRAASSVHEGDPWAYQDRAPDAGRRFRRAGTKVGSTPSDTTYFGVVDRWGNAVSELQSVQSVFGSSLVAGSTGILLNNRMTYWHLDEDHIDALNPGQRVRHTMNPVMVFTAPPEDGGRLEMVCGTPGADTQVQTNMQVLSAVIDHGFTVSEAVDMPRWTHVQDGMQSTYPHSGEDALQYEARAPRQALDELRRLGHNVVELDPWGGAGSEAMIQVNTENGVLMAAADARRDGQALVW